MSHYTIHYLDESEVDCVVMKRMPPLMEDESQYENEECFISF